MDLVAELHKRAYKLATTIGRLQKSPLNEVDYYSLEICCLEIKASVVSLRVDIKSYDRGQVGFRTVYNWIAMVNFDNQLRYKVKLVEQALDILRKQMVLDDLADV